MRTQSSTQIPARSVRLAAARRMIQRGIATGVFPGVVVQVRREARVVWHEAFGSAAVIPRRRPMAYGAVFDLASLTKPIATATAVLQLWQRGTIDLDRPVADYLQGFGVAGKQAMTVRHLLTHTSGLPAWIRLYLRVRTPAQALRYLCALSPASPPGSRVEYSDLGFIVLGELVRACTRLPLDQYLHARIAPPLRWQRTRFRPPPAWRRRCVATEAGDIFERAAAGPVGASFRWRDRVIVGNVHDGNSYYVYRGVAGHAGLFSTAEEVGRFGQAMLDHGTAPHGQVLTPAIVAEAIRDQTERLADGRGLGWRCRRGSGFMGTKASPASFGHTGFTGTSLLVDPARALVVVLLTNRVHPRATNTAIESFRAAFHDIVIEAIER